MSDIFISYASEDRERAKVLAQALEAEGWTVWWDRMIPFGRPFDEVIQENLTAAKCVLVLWTDHSVTSKWVRSEAAAAEERHTLVPVMLDEGVQLPLAFKLLQAVNLHGWEAGVDNAEYDKMLAQIRALIAGDGTGTSTPSGVPEPRKRTLPVKRRSWLVLAFLVLPSLVAVGAALILMNWRVPTQIELALQVDRLGFALAGNEPIPLLERAVTFNALSLEQLARVDMQAARFTPIAPSGPTRSDIALSLEGAPQDRMSADFEAETTGEPAGRLAALSVEPGTQVVLEMRPATHPSLVLRVDSPALESAVLPARALLLTTSNATVTAPADFTQAPRWRALMEISEADPIVAVRGIPTAFTAIVTPAKAMQVLPDGGAAVTQIELLKQTAAGGYASALVAPAKLGYPGYAKDGVSVDAGSLLSVEGLRNATLSAITIEPGQTDLAVKLRGTVDKIQSRGGSGAALVDHRLSLFDQLWYGARTALLFSIAVWVVSVTVGAYKLAKEARQG